MSRYLKNNRAITLVEAIAASIILAFLVMGFLGFQYIIGRSNQQGVQEIILQRNQSMISTLIRNVVQGGNHIFVQAGRLEFLIYDSNNQPAGNFRIATNKTFTYSNATHNPDNTGTLKGDSVYFDMATPAFDSVANTNSTMLAYRINLVSNTRAFGSVVSVIRGRAACRN